jgi:acetoacetate decarboxylase
MKPGEKRGGIPLFSSPYQVPCEEFSEIEVLHVTYYTTYDAVKDLVPEQLELDDEPLITMSIYKYGFGSCGPYNEFVAAVEVTYQGKRYKYSLVLILDNESATFDGRERWGIPKVFGHVNWNPTKGNSGGSVPTVGYLTGHVERPIGSPLVHFSFRPQKKVQAVGPYTGPRKVSLHLRSIPHPRPDHPPVIQEFIASELEIKQAEIWTGEVSIGLPDVSAFEAFHKLKPVRYVSAILLRNCVTVLHYPEAVFPLL